MEVESKTEKETLLVVPEIQTGVPTIKNVKHTPPRGRPISGRVWKEDLGLSERASAKIKVTALRSSWKVKEARRAQLKAIKDRQRAATEAAEAERIAERERIKQSRERRAANAMKNVKFQVVTNTAKLKKISKAQWKNYRKLSDINKW